MKSEDKKKEKAYTKAMSKEDTKRKHTIDDVPPDERWKYILKKLLRAG